MFGAFGNNGGYLSRPMINKNGLVFHYDATDPDSYPLSGNLIKDIGGSNITGTLNNVVFQRTGRGRLYFDGVYLTHITTGNTSLSFAESSFTICAWVYAPTAAIALGFCKIVNKGLSTAFPTPNRGYHLRLNGSLHIEFSVSDGGAFATVREFNDGDFKYDKWQYVVGVCNRVSGQHMLYLNGFFNNSIPITYGNINSPEAPISIGSLDRSIYGPSGENLLGYVGEVEMYERALNPLEILRNYNKTKNKYL